MILHVPWDRTNNALLPDLQLLQGASPGLGWQKQRTAGVQS